jgi:hypothetical protein
MPAQQQPSVEDTCSLFLAEFRPKAYLDMASTGFKEGQQTSNPELFSRWL